MMHGLLNVKFDNIYLYYIILTTCFGQLTIITSSLKNQNKLHVVQIIFN